MPLPAFVAALMGARGRTGRFLGLARAWYGLWLGLACWLAVAPAANARQSDNHGIHAVPPPGAVVVDGELGDWDLSGSILVCYDLDSLLDIYSAKVAMMHDAKHLYVAIQWRDATPMGNSHDPRFQESRGWAGDAIQMRLRTDRITHATAWYFAEKQEPYMKLDYGKSMTEPFGGGGKALTQTKGWELTDGAAMAFKALPDGKGYVQEIRLPWSLITLTGEPPANGQLACGLELLWGEQDWPVHRYADNLAEGKTSREFFWTAREAWGPVWLSPKGKLSLPEPTWLRAEAEAVAEGPIPLTYTLAKDSRVTLAIDDAQGRRVRNLLAAMPRQAGAREDLWDGLDDRGQLVAPGKYSFKGLSHDGLHVNYVGSFASPGDPPWSTADNRGGYYGDHTPPEAVAFGPGDRGALACAMGEAGRHLIGVDLQGRRQWGLANRAAFGGGRISLATDGKLLWVANVDGRNGQFTIWRCDLRSGAYAPWAARDAAGQPILDLVIRPTDGMAQCRAIAVHQGTLAVLLAGERKVLLLNGETGETVREWAELPAGLSGASYRADGQLLLTAGTELIRLDPATGARQVLASDLVAPHGVAVDAQGRIFVSQRGAFMGVAIYSAEGQPQGRLGKPGGRPGTGFFDSAGMLNPSQLAVDSKGRVWVTEGHQQPKRTSVWEATGALAFDLIGTTAYAAGGVVNPFDATRAFSEEVEYRLTPGQPARPLFTLGDALGTGHGWVTRFAKINDREYLQVRSTARGSAMVKLFVRQPDGAWRHCAELGLAGRGKSLEDKSNAQWNRAFAGPLWEGRFGHAFCWVDANDDGQASRDEIDTIPGPLGACYWGQAMGEDLTVVVPQGADLLVLKPQGFSAGGTPRYRLAEATRIQPGPVAGEGMLMVGRAGRIYVNQTPLRALSPTGETLWTYPNPYLSVHGSHRATAPRPGLLIGPSSIYGTAMLSPEIGEVFLLNGNLGQNFLFTEDGLWVQSLFNDTRGWFDQPAKAVVGMPCDAMTAGGESFGGGFGKSSDGKVYLLGGGTAAVIMEVTGLETLKRFAGELTVTPEQLLAADQLRVRNAARTLTAKRATIARVATPLPVGKDLSAWDLPRRGVPVIGGAGAVGTAMAAYDDQTLYLAWQVKDSTPLKNGGQDDKLLFITGDAVDFMLRANAEARGPATVAGDLRLLLALKGGQPVVMLYEPVAPGAAPDEGADLSSPWRTLRFARVRRLTVPVALVPASGGYTVTAAVPLATLGLKDLAGKNLRGDFGILLSDSAGQECTSRNYWSNQAANNTNDVPDEAQLTPALWGELVFE